MILGHGDIASVLTDREDLILFASGVSNSQEKEESEYQREVDLLMSQRKDKRLVYFSSLSIFYSTNRYTKHKRYMEQLVKNNFGQYTIIRIGNITWGTNPHTIINFLRNRVENNQPIDIQDTYRYIVDKNEFLHWMNLIPLWNCEMNIPGQRMTIQEIVNKYVYLGTKYKK